MADNPYTQTKTVTITELVPRRDQLPYCRAWKLNGEQCPFHARWLLDNKPVCGQHVGRPSIVFVPERMRR